MFKRIEVWLLFVLLLGGLGYVFYSQSGGSFGGSDPIVKSEDSKITIQRIRLKRDHSNYIAEIDLEYDNKGGDKFFLGKPHVQLFAEGDEPVEHFFLAIHQLPEIPADDTGSGMIRYWLEKSHLGGRLWIDVQGDRLLIKNEKAFSVDAIENNATLEVSGLDWSASL